MPSSAISGARSATSRSRNPSARTTPTTSGVDSSSWVLRSRFSRAAPPTCAESGRSARTRSTVSASAGSEGSTVGTAWISTRSAAVAGGLRRHHRGDAGVVGQHGGGGVRVGLVDHDLQRARGALAEGLLHAVVADPCRRLLGQHLDRGHRGLQTDDAARRAPAARRARPARRRPDAARAARPTRRTAAERCSPDVHPRQRELVDPQVELGQHDRQQGQRRGQHEERPRA